MKHPPVEFGGARDAQILTLPADLLTPVGAFLRLRQAGEHPFLMESVAGGEQLGRFSILGINPTAQLLADAPGNASYISGQDRRQGSLRELLNGFVESPMEAIPGLPFSGGLVGVIGFDFIYEIESFDTRFQSRDAMAWFGDYRCYVVFDHLKQCLHIVKRDATGDENEIEAIADLLRSAQSPDAAHVFKVGPCESNHTRDEYCKHVETFKKHIRAGDIFQGVLSQRFSRGYDGDPFQLYRALRRVNPSPYMFYHETPIGTMIGASPELQVKISNRRVVVMPIAGTRPRGATEAEDARHEQDLLADPKERAEHTMLVDLARNDVGRVADFGSVAVQDFAEIHRFSHVMHMVSEVDGRLAEGKTAVDALAASFPAGTVSGAPKVRALELILEHEPTARGLYSGAAGFLSVDGSAEFCITLRTAFASERLLTYQAGAGIVADSDPEREYAETKHKAAAIERAITMAGGES